MDPEPPRPRGIREVMAKTAKRMTDEIAAVLRARNRELEKELKAQTTKVQNMENQRLTWERRADAAEKQAEDFYDIIRAMAEVIPNTTSRGRMTRQFSRLKLEKMGVKPPSTLGSSRQREPIKKKKKKKS